MRTKEEMLERDLRGRGISDERVLAAFEDVDRADFLPEELKGSAYEDGPLPIGGGQTISQPYIVAYMLEQLGVEEGETVLEVGVGSGYVAALLAQLADRVIGTEANEELAKQARERLAEYRNVDVLLSTRGAPGQAPFERILVSAAAPELPSWLHEQLAEGGVAVVPLGEIDQWLYRITKRDGELESERLIAVRFVPLTT